MQLKKKLFLFGIVITSISIVFCDTGFLTDWDNTIYKFDTNNPSVVTPIITGLSNPDCITVSPDGETVYFTSSINPGGDVYTFPVNGPYVATAVGTGIEYPIGIAISGDGTTCFVVTNESSQIYSFPTGVLNPTVTTLTSTGATIGNSGATLIAIGGDTAYVSNYYTYGGSDSLYSFPITSNQTTYNATEIQSLTDGGGSGLAVSSDGYLYWSASGNGNISRVPLSAPSSVPETIAIIPTSTGDGLAISHDGTVGFICAWYTETAAPAGLYTFPTNEGPSQVCVAANVTDGYIAVAIVPQKPSPSPTPKVNDLVEAVIEYSRLVPLKTLLP